jgi:hypothetical protein
MKRFALISNSNNLVLNIIILNDNSTYTPPNDTFMVDVSDVFVDIGWVYDATENQFIQPTLTESDEP